MADEPFDVEAAFTELTSKIDKILPEEPSEPPADDQAPNPTDGKISALEAKIDQLLAGQAKPRQPARTARPRPAVPPAPERKEPAPEPPPSPEPEPKTRGWFR